MSKIMRGQRTARADYDVGAAISQSTKCFGQADLH